MAKSAAERKAAQRQREKQQGTARFIVELDSDTHAALTEACQLRRPQREPYDMDEYIYHLVMKDRADLVKELEELSKRKCKRCGDALPGETTGCPLIGEVECWQTLGWHDLKFKAP